ncbi:634_t:CDS:2, partial [Entrophospora sp. SA101]
LCEYKIANSSKTYEEIGNKFGIDCGGEWSQLEEALAIWIDNANRANYTITEHYKVGEAASAPIDDLPEFRAELKSLIAEYDLNDVYNADETALYWKLEPNKTLSS